MSKWYEILIASSITALVRMFFKFVLQSDGEGDLISFFGIAILITAYFQIKNTDGIVKYKYKEWIDDGDKMAKTPWFWIFCLILNTFMVGCFSVFLYFAYGFIFSFFGYKMVYSF